MEIKDVRKEYLVAIIVIVVAGAFLILFRTDLTRFWYEFRLGDRCGNEDDFGAKYEEGFVVVVLNGTLKEREVLNLVESYGLSLQQLSKTSYDSREAYEAMVIVTKGRERLWMCVLTEFGPDTVVWVHPVGRLVPW